MTLIKKLIAIDVLTETVRRFPISVFCLVCSALILTAGLYDFIPSDWDKTFGKIGFLLSLGFFWSGGVSLLSEERGLSTLKQAIIVAVGFVGLYLIVFGMGGLDEGAIVRVFALMVSLLAFITYAPFIGRRDTDDDFWAFNFSLWLGVIFSVAASLLFYAGIAGALASIKALFDVDFGYKIWALLSIICFSVIAPLYCLSFVPTSFRQGQDQCQSPKPMTFFITWMMLPLVMVYFIILYAYFAKAAIGGEILHNHVVYMIAGFAAAGIFAYLISWPLQKAKDEGGSAFARFFRRAYFPLLIVPTLIMIYAMADRIGDFGVTEKRYCVMLFGLWLIAIIITRFLNILRLWHIMASFSLLLFFSSFGPWGMSQVSFSSQMNRFETLLTANGSLVEGEIIATDSARDISFDDRGSISSIYDYLKERGDHTEIFYGYAYQKEFFDALGFDYIRRFVGIHGTSKEEEYFSYSNWEGEDYYATVTGYDYYIHGFHISNDEYSNRTPRRIGGLDLTIGFESDNTLLFTIKGERLRVDLNNYLPEKEKDLADTEIKLESASYKIKFQPYSISGHFDEQDKALVHGISIRLWLKRK